MCILPYPSKIAAITNLSGPTNKKGIQSLLAMCTTFSKWSNKISFSTPHLRASTGKTAKFKWEDPHEDEFKEVKRLISELTVLALHDINLPTVLYVDWLEDGIG